ncbi:MAG: signal peptidase I [bacterium]|nr:signal peptidase I [bacterium]
MAAKESEGISKGRYVFYICIILASIVIVYLFLFRGMNFFLVPSSSMEPTLHPRDYIVTFRESSYYRGDIVVLKDPLNEGEFLVKRIVGVNGDTIEITGGALYINDSYASEPYTKEPMQFSFGAMTVGPGDVFVLGDNRNNSEDSVTWKKPASLKAVIGKVCYIYNPINRMGSVDSFPLTNAEGR